MQLGKASIAFLIALTVVLVVGGVLALLWFHFIPTILTIAGLILFVRFWFWLYAEF